MRSYVWSIVELLSCRAAAHSGRDRAGSVVDLGTQNTAQERIAQQNGGLHTCGPGLIVDPDARTLSRRPGWREER